MMKIKPSRQCKRNASRKRGNPMNISKWLAENTESLKGKTVAVTGSTGGLGLELCRYLASLGASLILLDRNEARSLHHRDTLLRAYPDMTVQCIHVDLAEMASVKDAVAKLKQEPIDLLIHNAGAYSIPRKTCDTGLDNVFQINFASPYYMIRELLPTLRARRGHVMAVGSIAHRYSKTDADDIDFSTRKKASLVYGNAKRYLMFALYELFQKETSVTLSITHPGITFTNITAHYPKVIFAVIKHPMKIIFMKPKKAALSLLAGCFQACAVDEWIGPRCFDIWGLPKKRTLRSVSEAEQREIGKRAAQIYQQIK